MKTRTTRSAIRGKRGASKKRLVLTPPGKRTALLGGTALATGVLAGLGAFLAMPNPALAACGPDGPGTAFVCSDATGAFTYEVNGSPWLGTLVGNENANPAVNTGTLLINNNGDHTGTLDINEGASITVTTGATSALILQNTAGTRDSEVTINLHGTITNTITGAGTGVAADGMRLQGGTVIVNVSESGVVDATDDGIRFLSGTTKAHLTNYGSITGRGDADTASDKGFGVEFNNGSVAGPPINFSELTGDLEIDNYGDIIGRNDGVLNLEGAGIQVATTGQTDIHNYDGGEITGYYGIWIQQNENGGGVKIENWGHIEGGFGSGVHIETVAGVLFGNHSYMSVMGTTGLTIDPAGQAVVDNAGGLTAGLTVNGITIANISGLEDEDGNPLGPDDWAVDVYNGSAEDDRGGVIAGFINGLEISNVGFGISEGEGGPAVDILIDNAGRFQWSEDTDSWVRYNGGLIAGVTGNGVQIADAPRNVFIDNSLTRLGSIDLNALDPQVYNSEGEGGLLFGVLPGGAATNNFSNGIYGAEYGIGFTRVDGVTDIRNAAGQIVGKNQYGIAFQDVFAVYIDNSGTGDGGLLDEFGGADVYGAEVTGGTIWGGIAGIGGYQAFELYVNNNIGGQILGVQDGIAFDDGLVSITSNLGGTIDGYRGAGLAIHNTDKVGVFNGGWQDGSVTHEGRIMGGDNAFSTSAAKVGFFNLPGGMVIGDGNDADGQAVIDMRTYTEGFFPGTATPSAIVFNAGIMTSDSNPHIERGFGPLATNEFLPDPIDAGQIVEDAGLIALFAMSGGTLGSVTVLGGTGDFTIGDYRQTASDGLIVSEGGGLLALNLSLGGAGLFADDEGGSFGDWFRDEGIMFGRIVATGVSDGCEFFGECDPEGDVGLFGNVVVNMGSWFVTNAIETEGEGGGGGAYGGTILTGPGHNAIYNLGFTQTAFGVIDEDTEGGTTGDYTSFVVDDFYNGSFGDFAMNMGGEGDFDLLPTGGAGWLSMVDGDADDHTYIYGNYHGATDPNFRSYLAVDADLSATGWSDVLWIGPVDSEGSDNLFGSTGIVVNDLSVGAGDVEIGQRILVVSASGIDMNWISDVDPGNTCFYDWCRDGDTFFISELNPNYININGIGFIGDGMYMWGLTEEPSKDGQIPDPEFYFVAEWGPDAYQQPTLTSAAQSAWHSTGGVVQDHVYGNIFPQGGAGGAGADLLYDAPMVPAPAASAHSGGSALWGRLTGDWSNRDTQVIVDEGEPGELTFDTGFNQNTYSLLGGLEFRPNGGDSQVRLGLFGGYIGSQVKYDDYGATASLDGGTVGGYGALVSGGWYADAEVKGDFLNVTYTSPSTEISTRATSVGVLANTGFRMESGAGFLEPILSVAYVNTKLNPASGGGADVTYSNGQSVRGGIGARVGTTMVGANGTSTELDLLGKVWNEFGAANVVTISDGVNPSETFTDGITGVFGEVVGRATFYSADRRTSGFVSGGAQFGTEWTTWSAKAGLRQGF